MPSIWPWGGLGVALGGLSVQGSGLNVQGSMLDVLPITFVHSFPARRAAFPPSDFRLRTLDFGLRTLAEGCAESRLVTAGCGRFDGSALLEIIKSEDRHPPDPRQPTSAHSKAGLGRAFASGRFF